MPRPFCRKTRRPWTWPWPSTSLHTQLEEGYTNNDFGPAYPDYRWVLYTHAIPGLTNGLFQVDVTVYHENQVFSSTQIYLYRPDSKKTF